jgi:predicted RNase H-like nuclease (RuvC/YqgF family)
LANALAEDERVKESDEIIMKKMERIQDLEEINEAHKKLNGELRQEVYDWKMKAAEVIKLNNTIQGQKQLIEELQRDNRNLAKQVDDSVNRLRKSGVI